MRTRYLLDRIDSILTCESMFLHYTASLGTREGDEVGDDDDDNDD